MTASYDDPLQELPPSTGGLWGKTAASQRRREELVASAKGVFFAEGFRPASMDRIAQVAGTTKRTLYDHFGSKEALFAECIRHGCGLFLRSLPQIDPEPASLETAIGDFARATGKAINTRDSLSFQRMVLAEAQYHPEFARVLHEASFVACERILARQLAAWIESGRLRRHDSASWASTLMDVAINAGRNAALFMAAERFDEDRSARAIERMVGIYVRAFSAG